MEQWLYSIWFDNRASKWLLAPLTLLFVMISSLRRWMYRTSVLSSHAVPIPVIVIGNISVGGNGKTPVVIELISWLKKEGYAPGVLSRGYGAKADIRFPRLVSESDTAEIVGDEPKLIANRTGCQVVIDPKRPRGAKHLVDLGCDVIVCDDGLQHYALQRDIEWVVMDDRGVGNGCRLPMGPLREPISRLHSVDAVIHNGSKPLLSFAHKMKLNASRVVNMNTHQSIPLEEFNNKYPDGLVAMAGIGNPLRFFEYLNTLGIKTSEQRGFADHHKFQQHDIPNVPVIMTEKDAIKCGRFSHSDCWYLPVEAQIPVEAKRALLEKLNDK